MNENPYAPPAAVVTDVESPVSLERPSIVVLAVRFLWAGFAVSVVSSIYGLFILPQDVPKAFVVAFTTIGLAIAAAISYGIFTAAWRGRGWARWLIAVLVILAVATIAGMWAFLPRTPVFPWQTTAAFVIRMTFYITAIVLLFSPAASAWYREMKRRR
jgi:peptidoglycan/LPS O-acetylase OafA/YrhL